MPAWDLFYPTMKPGQRLKVMAYAWKIDTTTNKPPPFIIAPCPDLCTHPCLQILDIAHVREKWRIINFYHDVRDKSGLEMLLALNLDLFTPMLVLGNFNKHSRLWSPDNVDPSHWAWKLEEWAVSNLLTLANSPGTITHQGTNNEQDSVIDLAWFNATAISRATFSDLQVDLEGSLGSDHAVLHITARTKPDPQCAPVPTADPGYLIEDGVKQKWLETFTQLLMCQTPLQPSPELTREEVDLTAKEFEVDINDATASTCRK